MASRSIVAVALGSLLGCEPSPWPQEPDQSSPTASVATSAVAQPSVTASATVGATAANEPSWSWKGPEPGFGASFYKGPITIDTKQGTCRFVYEDKTKMRRIECLREKDRAWGVDEGGAFEEDASIGADEERLYVALFSNISSGCEVRAYHLERGDELWRTQLIGLGPIDHSEYLNEVQIGLMPGKVQVLGWESAGRYIELLDGASGRSLSTFRIDPRGKTSLIDAPPPKAVAEPPHPGIAGSVRWGWQGPEPGRKKSQDVTISLKGKGQCAFKVDDKTRATHLFCEDAAKKRLWGVDRAQQFVPAGALIADDKRVFFADYSEIATGATVSAFDRGTGRVLWKTALFGAGPVSHSKYRNEVEMALVDGRLAIFGWESAGKYVEVLDPSTGSDLGNRKEP